MYPNSTRILVVDDMSTMRLRLINLLKTLGFTDVVQAANGQEALAMLERLATEGKSIDLIISDWNMPIMSGIDLLCAVKAKEGFSQIPFVMVTAEGEMHQVARAVREGVSDYVIKPIDRFMLQRKLDALWNKLHPTYESAS